MPYITPGSFVQPFRLSLKKNQRSLLKVLTTWESCEVLLQALFFYQQTTQPPPSIFFFTSIPPAYLFYQQTQIPPTSIFLYTSRQHPPAYLFMPEIDQFTLWSHSDTGNGQVPICYNPPAYFLLPADNIPRLLNIFVTLMHPCIKFSCYYYYYYYYLLHVCNN